MITAEIRSEIRRLVLIEKWLVGTVARRYGVHHSVVTRALQDEGQGQSSGAKERTQKPSVLEPHKPYIVKRIEELPQLSCVRLYAELKERGYQHGIAVLKRYVAKLRPPRPRKAYLRIETEPAEQAQVDWGSFGYMHVGATQRPVSVFSMVLSWSRALYIDFSFDQQMETFMRMHRRALEFFGGVPKRILYDNLKSVVLHRVGSTIQFNPRFLHLAGHYLFECSATPVRYPQAKGRVESSIKYIRHSFFYGRSFSSLENLRAQAALWRDQVANQRLHATTRQRPCDRLAIERKRLHALPAHPFDTDLVVPTIVTKEARVRLDANSYSVPPEYVGKSVHIRADDKNVRVICDDLVIANHPRSWQRRLAIEDPAHIDALLERRKAAQAPKRKERFVHLSHDARLYLQEIARRHIDLDSETRKLWKLVDRYGKDEVLLAITKSIEQRSYGVKYVQALCDQARFAKGLCEAPEPIITGHAEADALTLESPTLEDYDELF